MSGALHELGARAISISDQVRKLSHQIHPAALEALGLADALRSFVRETVKRHGVNLRSEVDGIGRGLPLLKATCIYRVAQEAASDAINYAQADNLTLAVRSDGDG